MGRDYSLFSSRLLAWYDQCRRDLPWRTKSGLPPAYHVLVSELMLQQTQVVTVIPYFHRFLKQFPTIQSLADARLQKVLHLWQGLGYYSRARNLHALAQQVVKENRGAVPSEVEQLLELPGIGRYTAGAIASLAFDRRAPILDGNVARVLCRLDCIKEDPRSPATIKRLWQRAGKILPQQRVGDFNSALMELGATVCMPRLPDCPQCPVRSFCQACKKNLQQTIPLPKKSKPLPLVHRTTWCIQSGRRWLIEQRPSTGRWAGLWQFITLPANDPPQNHSLPPLRSSRKIALISHTLTHRHYRFKVMLARAATARLPRHAQKRKWLTLNQLKNYPLPAPHLKIAQLLSSESSL